MSTFNFNTDFTYQKDFGISSTPTLLSGGMGDSLLPRFIATQVDRSIYGATEGGAGRWMFGAWRTPQRWLIDNINGWDPDVAGKIDPSFTPKDAQNIWNSTPDTAKAAVLYKGGQELVDDIINNSVSSAHAIQRITEIEAVARASYAIDRYDEELGALTYGAHKMFSGIVNYAASDPLTTISIAATGGLAAAGVGATAAGTAASQAGTIASIASKYNKTWRAATYLWDGLDGASSGYSSYKQLTDDGYRVYGKTYENTESLTASVAFGGLFGLGFSIGGDAIGVLFKKQLSSTGSTASIENMAASSAEGSLGTAIDHVAQSQFRASKSRLEKSLDTIVGPDSDLRRLLMDDDARGRLGYGASDKMDSLSDWIEKNKPNAAELNEHVNDITVAAERNRQTIESWQGEVEDFVLNGGDQGMFFRKKAIDLLRQHMGEDFAQYRFIVDYLEEASGDIRLVAEWMAHGDKDRVIRAANAINANKRVSVLEDTALANAMNRISAQGVAAAADEARQAINRINDNVTQGRFQGAVDILNEMHQEVTNRHGQLLGEIDANINHLNDALNQLNEEAFERLDHFKEAIDALNKVRARLTDATSGGRRARTLINQAMDPEADNATVMLAMQDAVSDLVPGPRMAEHLAELKEAIDKFRKAEADVASTLDDVRRTRRSVVAKTTTEGLNRTMSESGSFPLWKYDISEAGYHAVRRSAARQTMAGNRWKVEFVDRFLGEGAADKALNSGTNPMRPVLQARKPMERMTVEQQDAVLREELERVAPDIAKVKSAAADMTLDQRIADARDTVQRLQSGLDSAKAMLDRRPIKGDDAGTKLSKMIGKRERLIKRMNNMIKRMENQLQGQLDELNKDLPDTAAVTADDIRAIRANERRVAHTKSAQKLAEMSKTNPEKLTSKSGRNLRNKVRKDAAAIDSNTEYGALNKEVDLINAELSSAQKKVNDLEKAGATDADPALKAARDEQKYLEKELNKARSAIDAIDNRPAMIRRSHELNGNNPPVNDVVELSRLRAQIGVAVEMGDKEWAEELNRRLYAKYGDANRLPRWTALEDFFLRTQRAAMNGQPVAERLLSVSMDGRNVKFSIAEQTQDIAVREGVAGEAASLRTMPEMPSGKGVRVPTEESKKAVSAMRDQQLLERALETDAEAAAARIPQQNVKYETGAVSSPVDGLSAKSPTAKTASAGGKTDLPEPPIEDRILTALLPAEAAGERLLVMNELAHAMGRIPAMRAMGRALFKLQTAGTGFGQIHASSRILDMMVTAFNMLDRPEALTKSLGYNKAGARTLQSFRDQGRIAVNELAVAEQRARKAGHYTAESDVRLQDVLDTGDASALNAGERAMYDVMRRHYDEVGRRLAVSHGEGTLIENYRPREGNTNAILARQNEAQNDFTNVYMERMQGSGEALPDELADRFGIPRGTSWSALTPEEQNTFMLGLREYCRNLSAETIARLTNSVTEDGVGFRRAARTPSSASARKLEDAVARDPRIRRWYIQSPVQEHKLYMEIRAPQIRFDAQLSELVGMPTTFDDVISALKKHSVTIKDSAIRSEFDRGVRNLEDKWRYHTGRAQYRHDSILDPALRIGTGIVRGSAGAFWGLAGLTTELPRAIFASRMYGGGVREGIIDAMHSIRNANDLGVMEDISHGVDQYSSHAHSSFGSSVGTSISERFIAPWERFWHVVRGDEVVTDGGVVMNRVTGSAVALAEAYGETGMRAGMMQYFSGIARVVADRQAKRFLSRNIDNMERLSIALRNLGPIQENTDAARLAFKNACESAGIPYDVAIQMNHAGLLDSDVIAGIKNGLTGQDQVFNLSLMRGRVDDRTMGALMDFLTSAHNFHVPTSSLATSVAAGSAIEKLFYNLTSYSRAFSLNVAFRTAANGRLSTMLATYAALMVGENIYQGIRGIASGKTTPEKMDEEWSANPVGYFMANAIKTPWLGAHNTSALAAVESFTGAGNVSTRGNNIIGPLTDSFRKFSKVLYSDEKTGERDWSFFQTYPPVINAWYSRLMIGTDME